MILVDHPYVSDLLRRTIMDHNLPVVLTPAALNLGFESAPGAISETAAIELVKQRPNTRVLSNSENAIGWVAENLKFTGLPEAIDLFKNKVRFRQLLEPMYPDFRFKEISPGEIPNLDPRDIGHPFVLKPAVGFFSLGVHVINQPEDWPQALNKIQGQLDNPHQFYPAEVLDSSSFILEEIITGTEYAIDAYFDGEGVPVITNILEHLFSSDADVSDRVYMTSEKIVRENLAPFTGWLASVGNLVGLRDFPVHVEVRVNAAGQITPIEINPMRFGGWCTTADLTAMAYDFNPYVAFLADQRPDWDAIFSTRHDKVFSLVVLDNSTGLAPSSIKSFDFEKLSATFAKPLEIRPIDHNKHPLFGFLFAETAAENPEELKRILHSTLVEFTQQ